MDLEIDSLVSKAWNFLYDRNQEQFLLKSCSLTFKQTADTLAGKLGYPWNGETVNQLRRLGFLGLTHFYIEKCDQVETNVVKDLIALDCTYEDLCIPSLISACWRKLEESKNTEVLAHLYDLCSDKNYIRAAEIMREDLDDEWNGSTFIQLKRKNYCGFAHFFMSKIVYVGSIFLKLLLDLIQIDAEYGTSFDETISASWEYLIENESLLLSLLEKSDTVYARAMEIFYNEFGRKSKGESYEKLRLNSFYYGYTSRYVRLSANYNKFSSSAYLSVVEKLARLDLKKGTTIPELVFSCCKFFPKKTAIKKIIELRKKLLVSDEPSYETEKQLAEKIFNFRNQNGFNCLIVLFNYAIKRATHKLDDTKLSLTKPMIREIEDSCYFLIRFAESNNLDMKTLLNARTKNGNTMFNQASRYSKLVATYLLEFGVNINSVNGNFLTPSCKVRFKLVF